MDKKWIVAVDTDFYPEIHEYGTEEEALAAYEGKVNDLKYYEEGTSVYMAEVKKIDKKA